MQSMIQTTVTSPGIVTEKKKMPLSLSKEVIKGYKPKQLMRAITKMAEYDDPTQALLKEAAEDMPDEVVKEEVPAPGPVEEEDVVIQKSDVQEDMPPGARMLKGSYEAISSVIGNLDAALSPIEHPEVKAKTTEILDELRGTLVSIEGIFSATYPDQPALSGETVEVTEDTVKSFLSSSNRVHDQLAALAARCRLVQSAAATGKLGPQHQKMLTQTASDLARLHGQAKSHKPVDAKAIEKQVEAKYAQAIGDLQKKFTGLLESLGSTPAQV